MKKSFVFIFAIFLLFISFIVSHQRLESYAETIEGENCLVKYNTPECYQQAKDLWSDYTIGGGSIGNNGCGIVSLTNAVNYVTGNYIDPIELANYAYSIDAYNGSMGGGTARWVLYHQLETYEKKFGFKVVETGRTSNVLFPKLIDHLKNGGVTVAHVYGHFIAIVGYDENTKSYLVYDCAANPIKRESYPYGTWMTEKQLTTLKYMTVDWFCLISKTTDGIIRLDQEGHIYQNSKALVSYSVTNTENNQIPVSGFALDTRGIESFCYVVDSEQIEYSLQRVYKEGILEQFPNYKASCEAKKIGFEGYIDTSSLTIGEHRIIVRAKTNDGGVRDIAEIMVNKSNKEASIDEVARTNTIDMSRYKGQTDVAINWQQAGINDYHFRGNYGRVIDLGRIDLSMYKKAEIIYSTDANFDADTCGIQSVIGLKSANLDFGYYGKPLDFTKSIVYTNMVDAKGGWTTYSTATLDLTNVNYNGPVYLNGYNQQNQMYVVHRVILYYNDDYVFHRYSEATCTEPRKCIDCGKLDGVALGHNYVMANCQHATFCARCNQVEGELGDHEWKKATCFDPKTCDACGLTEGSALGHDYKETLILPTCEEEGYNEHKCSRCFDIYKTDWIASLGHHIEHVEALAATCTTGGHNAYDQCTRCEYTTKVETKLLGHNYETTTILPTCEEQGYNLNTCTRCMHSYRNKKVSALGHDLIQYNLLHATCTEEGHTAYTACTRCTYTTKEVIQALGHDLMHHEGLLPTCTTIGYDAYDSCTRCTYCTKETKEPLGHELIHMKGRDATCTEDGYKDYDICQKCEYTTYQLINAKGHSLIYNGSCEPTCTESGFEQYVECTNCDYTTYQEIEAIGHHFQSEETAPTKHSRGFTTYTCTVCGYQYKDQYTEMIQQNCKKQSLAHLWITITIMTISMYVLKRKNIGVYN